MSTEEVTIPHKDKKIPAVYNKPVGEANGYAIILTHGAGGNMNNAQIQAVAEHLAEKGFLALRFTVSSMNIGYRIKVYNTVLNYLRDNNTDLKGCIMSGRSMGCRAAVGVSNEVKGTDLEKFVKGVMCLAYPLHPAEEMDNLRDEPLKTLPHPVLFVSGTKDAMAEKDLLEAAVEKIPSDAQIYWVEGADHSHKINRFKEKEINEGIMKVVTEWCQGVVDGKKVTLKKEDKGKEEEKVSSSKEKKEKSEKRKSDASDSATKKSKK